MKCSAGGREGVATYCIIEVMKKGKGCRGGGGMNGRGKGESAVRYGKDEKLE